VVIDVSTAMMRGMHRPCPDTFRADDIPGKSGRGTLDSGVGRREWWES
jgi:hypothetical protein